MAQSLLGQVMVVEPGIAQERGFQFLAGAKVMGAQQVGDAAVETLDHAIGLGTLGTGEPVFDAELGAQLVKDVFTRWRAFASGDETVGEFLAVIGQNRLDTKRRGLRQRRQKPLGVGRGLGSVDGHEDPARRRGRWPRTGSVACPGPPSGAGISRRHGRSLAHRP